MEKALLPETPRAMAARIEALRHNGLLMESNIFIGADVVRDDERMEFVDIKSVIPLTVETNRIPEGTEDVFVVINLSDADAAKFRDREHVVALLRAYDDTKLVVDGDVVHLDDGRWYGAPVVTARFISENDLLIVMHGFRHFFSTAYLALGEAAVIKDFLEPQRSHSGCSSGFSSTALFFLLPLLFLKR